MKKVKKFGRGGDILTGLGAVLVGKHLYDKYNEKDSAKNLNTIAGGEDKDAKAKKDIFAPKKTDKDKIKAKNPEVFGGNVQEKTGGGGNEGTITGENAPSSSRRDANELKSNILGAPDKSKTFKAEPGTGTSKGVDEKKLAQLQRRNVATKKKKVTTKPSESSANLGLGESTPKPVIKEIGTSTFPGQKQAALKTTPNEARPSKPYPEQQAAENLKREQIAAIRRSGQAPYFAYAPSGMGENMRINNSIARERQAKKQFDENKANMNPNKRDTEEETRQQWSGSGQGALKKGGMVKKYASGGSVKSASARADGCAIRGKTRA
jgi:hypothetical protein